MLKSLFVRAARPIFNSLHEEEEVKRVPWNVLKAYGVIGVVGYLVFEHFANKDTAAKAASTSEELEELKERVENLGKGLIALNGAGGELSRDLEFVMGALRPQLKAYAEEQEARKEYEGAKARLRQQEADAETVAKYEKNRKSNGKRASAELG